MMFSFRGLLLTAVFVGFINQDVVDASPPCIFSSNTLAVQIAESENVAIVEFIGVASDSTEAFSKVEFRAAKVLKKGNNPICPGRALTFPGDEEVTVDLQRSAHYILAWKDNDTDWWHLLAAADKTAWEYISSLPAPTVDTEEQVRRLTFFVDYLEHGNLLVSRDAFSEFIETTPAIVEKLASQFSIKSLRQWIDDPATPFGRRSLYYMMLGMCGNQQDISSLERRVAQIRFEEEYELNPTHIYLSYVFLTGKEGFDHLIATSLNPQTMLDDQGTQKPLPFRLTYGLLNTVRSLRNMQSGPVPEGDLVDVMKRLLEDPELSDLVIADLTRWKNWSFQQRLMSMFDEEEFQAGSIRRAIVRYMLCCAATQADDPTFNSQLVTTAKRNLQVLEMKAPTIYRDAGRFMTRRKAQQR